MRSNLLLTTPSLRDTVLLRAALVQFPAALRGARECASRASTCRRSRESLPRQKSLRVWRVAEEGIQKSGSTLAVAHTLNNAGHLGPRRVEARANHLRFPGRRVPSALPRARPKVRRRQKKIRCNTTRSACREWIQAVRSLGCGGA